MFAAFVYMVITASFLSLQKYVGLLDHESTYFGILILYQLSFLSYLKVYRAGAYFELFVFSICYILVVLISKAIYGRHFFELLIYSGVLLFINFIVLRRIKENIGKTKVRTLRDMADLKKQRLIIGGIVVAPFYFVLISAVPAFYEGMENSLLVIYVFGFLSGLAFVIGKRISGIYKTSEEV